jgi:hypothetical protein
VQTAQLPLPRLESMPLNNQQQQHRTPQQTQQQPLIPAAPSQWAVSAPPPS